MSASVPSGERFVLDVDNVQDWSVGVSSMNRINTTLSQLWTWFYVLLAISGRMMDFSIGSSLKARNCGVRTIQRGGGSIEHQMVLLQVVDKMREAASNSICKKKRKT